VGIGVLAEPQLAIRFMTAKDVKSLNRAIPIGGLFIICTTGVAFTVGALSNVYFYNTLGTVAVESVPKGNVDLILPTYINAVAPDYFIALFMIVLLAAAMSTLSSIFHTMGTAMGHDLWANIKASRWAPRGTKDESRKPSMKATRIGVSIMIVVTIGLAFIMPPSIIARATAMWFGLAACAMLPAYAHALFSKRLSTVAAKASLVVGTVSWFVWTALFHKAESSVLGISQALFGVDALLPLPWANVDPMMIALPLAFVALAIGYFLDSNTKAVQEIAVGQ
jgi:SSS family solute:Na+ symporter